VGGQRRRDAGRARYVVVPISSAGRTSAPPFTLSVSSNGPIWVGVDSCATASQEGGADHAALATTAMTTQLQIEVSACSYARSCTCSHPSPYHLLTRLR
jgi:hypothetical protein